MPKSRRSKPKPPPVPEKVNTVEVDGYLSGIFAELRELARKYLELTSALANMEARVELTEHHLRATRDHLALTLKDAAAVTIPPDWQPVLDNVEFVGLRLADACVLLLKRRKEMTPEELLHDLNVGMFRFRTTSPLREIHAALLRHPLVEREKDGPWKWLGDQPSLPMPIKVVDNTLSIVKEDAAESA